MELRKEEKDKWMEIGKRAINYKHVYCKLRGLRLHEPPQKDHNKDAETNQIAHMLGAARFQHRSNSH